MKKSLLNAAIEHAPRIVAADGAAGKLIRRGLLPEAVIGDFDSFSQAARQAIPQERLYPIAEQDSTDFEKCLSRIDAPLVIGVGFTGGRLDHQLAVLHGMMRYPDRPCLLLGRRDVTFLCPPKMALTLPADSRISFFPLADVMARSRGLFWPLDGLAMRPGHQIGTSNRVVGNTGDETQVTIEADAPALLAILPAAQLGRVVPALVGVATGRWGAR